MSAIANVEAIFLKVGVVGAGLGDFMLPIMRGGAQKSKVMKMKS
jgi:hypothetical protein